MLMHEHRRYESLPDSRYLLPKTEIKMGRPPGDLVFVLMLFIQRRAFGRKLSENGKETVVTTLL